jgi:hypothetical protein
VSKDERQAALDQLTTLTLEPEHMIERSNALCDRVDMHGTQKDGGLNRPPPRFKTSKAD